MPAFVSTVRAILCGASSRFGKPQFATGCSLVRSALLVTQISGISLS